jgi:uncharacterized alkaline shock family protein YloU
LYDRREVEGQPLISPDVLARYAADAAREVDGVTLPEKALHRGVGVQVRGPDEAPTIEIRVELEWGRSARGVAGEVQRRVAEYLERMARVTPAAVDVVVDGVGAPPARQ